MDRDIWVDAFENLESPNSPEPLGCAKVVHSSWLKAGTPSWLEDDAEASGLQDKMYLCLPSWPPNLSNESSYNIIR